MKRTIKQLILDMRSIGFRESGDNEIYTLSIELNPRDQVGYYFIEVDDVSKGDEHGK